MDEDLEKEQLVVSNISESCGGGPQKIDSSNGEEITRTKLFYAIYYACMQISDDLTIEIKNEIGKQMEFDGSVIAQTARIVMDALSETWPSELLAFAKHGKRSVVNLSDLFLLFRKNESLTSFIKSFNAEQTIRRSKQRQKENEVSKQKGESVEKRTPVLSARERKSAVSKTTKQLLPVKENPLSSNIKKFLNMPSASRSNSSNESELCDTTSKSRKRKSSSLNVEETKEESFLQEVEKIKPFRLEDLLEKKSCVMNKADFLKENGAQSSMTEKFSIPVDESSKSEENSCDAFDTIDWDAIDSLGTKTSVKKVLAKPTESQNSTRNIPNMAASSKMKNDESNLSNTAKDSYKENKKNRDSFTAFHFESDDEDLLGTGNSSFCRLEKSSELTPGVCKGSKLSVETSSGIGSKKISENEISLGGPSSKSCGNLVPVFDLFDEFEDNSDMDATVFD